MTLKRPTAAEAEQIQRRADRERHTPHALLELSRLDDACESLFAGLHREYLHSIASDRIAKWSAAAHASIDLLTFCEGRMS